MAESKHLPKLSILGPGTGEHDRASTSADRSRTRTALWRLAMALVVIGVLAQDAGSLCWGQQKAESKLLYLVARPSILDPLFAKSVVLMLPLKDEPLVVGLIINKPTRLTLHELFPSSRLLKDRPDTAYVGGPVDPEAGALVFHASKRPEKAMPLYGDVYVSFDARFITARLRDPKQTGDLRLFLGRAQWAPEQLEAEAFRGSWYSIRAEGDVIFEGHSDQLWRRMHDRARPRSDVENHGPSQPGRAPLRFAYGFPNSLFSGFAPAIFFTAHTAAGNSK